MQKQERVEHFYFVNFRNVYLKILNSNNQIEKKTKDFEYEYRVETNTKTIIICLL
jgi:hypothetical protein